MGQHMSSASVIERDIGRGVTRLFYACDDGSHYAVRSDDEHAATRAMRTGERVVITGNTDDQFARLVVTGIRPLVHLNGSSADHLLSTLSDACDALVTALRAVADAAPNARDYYPVGDHAWREANALHETYMRQLRAMRAEFVCAMEHVQEQIDQREERRRG